jgi:hypothetical protein
MVDRNTKSVVPLHYFRRGRRVSFRRNREFAPLAAGLAFAAAGLLTAVPGWSQYPGQITNNANKAPELRAIGVLEWTGPEDKPKQCRLVPVTIFDQGQLQDASIYMARPQPMALAGEVEYALEENGKTVGLFDIENSGQEQGSWVGYGTWKPLPGPPKPKVETAKVDDWEDPDDDKPVLHRKKHPGDAQSGDSSANGSSGASDSASNAPAPDPDRPVLHKSAESQSSSAPAEDPDRPKLQADKAQAQDVGHVDSLPEISDPDRPRLMRGKPEGSGLKVLPSLMGLPQDMEQAVAVSDAQNRPDHIWSYKWANPADEAKLKAELEKIARQALGLENAPAPASTAQAKRVSTTRKSLKPAQPLEPAPLADEHFRVFELAYGSGATLVLSAHTEGPLDKAKFVTLIAQPDLYGNVLVLLKNVTDGAHLDDTPRMKLIDAVDALADNRGELLFELRGKTQRQFALYRILRGQAQKLFVGGGVEVGSVTN